MNNTADLREHLDCPVFAIGYSSTEQPELPRALIDSLMVMYQRGEDSHIKVAG
jgi:hypothetical protein